MSAKLTVVLYVHDTGYINDTLGFLFLAPHYNDITFSTTPRRQRKYSRTVQSRSNRLSCLVYQDTSIIIKPHHTSIWSLIFLMRSYYNSVSDISSSYFVGCGDRDRATRTSFRTEGTLFLDDYYYAIAWWNEEEVVSLVGSWKNAPQDFALNPQRMDVSVGAVV